MENCLPERIEGKYRHEIKYQITYAEYLAIRARVSKIMKPDSHAGSEGKYLIRSLYFDNYRDKAVKEKRNGVKMREKFRIRYYNDDMSHMSLEKKIKNNGLCKKISAPITEEEYKKLLAGDTAWMISHKHPLIKELYVKMRQQLLRPRVIVSYMREPYIYPAGNVRVTFDTGIRTTLYRSDFDGEEVSDIGTEDSKGRILMELKYDRFIPDVIAKIVQNGICRSEAFSKYVECRKFG